MVQPFYKTVILNESLRNKLAILILKPFSLRHFDPQPSKWAPILAQRTGFGGQLKFLYTDVYIYI